MEEGGVAEFSLSCLGAWHEIVSPIAQKWDTKGFRQFQLVLTPTLQKTSSHAAIHMMRLLDKSLGLSGSHRSTHIASDLVSRALASQAKPQRESELQAFRIARPTSQDFRRLFSWHFPVISDQANVFLHR